MNKFKLYLFLFFSSSLVHGSDKNIPIDFIDSLQYLAQKSVHEHLKLQVQRAFEIAKEKEPNITEFQTIVDNFACFNEFPMHGHQQISLLDQLDHHYKTIVYRVIERDNDQLLKILLDEQTAMFVCNKDRFNYLHDAAIHHSHKVISLLLNHVPENDSLENLAKQAHIKKLALNMRNSYGYTPLEIAVNERHVNTVRALSQPQTDPRLENFQVKPNAFLKNEDGETPLSVVLCGYNNNIAVELLNNFYQGDDHDLNSFKTQVNQSSYLHVIMNQATYADVTETLKIILPKITDINCKDDEGQTALHRAVWAGNTEALSIILTYNPDLNIIDNDDESPLCLAVHTPNHEIFEMLLKAGADCKLRYGSKANTILHILAHYNHMKKIKILLEEDKTIINATNKKGQTALHDAIIHKRNEMALLLARHGASLRKKDVEGKTPLEYLAGKEWPMHQPSQSSQDIYYDNDHVAKQLMKAHRKYLMGQRPVLEQVQIIKDKKRKASEL